MNETVTVTMVSQEVNVGEWRAMGFSLDREMVGHRNKRCF